MEYDPFAAANAHALDQIRSDIEDRMLAASHTREISHLNRALGAEARLATVIELMKRLPIQIAASAKEPWMTLNCIDFEMVQQVAEGKSDPQDWVSVPCGMAYGGGPIEHSPHHWNDYEEGRDPLRIPHYCDGTLPVIARDVMRQEEQNDNN